jgi:hypothetical protein
MLASATAEETQRHITTGPTYRISTEVSVDDATASAPPTFDCH